MQALAPRSGHYTFDADSQSISHARRAARGFATEHGVPGELLEGIALAVSEACTNVVLHAYRDDAERGSMSLDLELRPHKLRIFVGDSGGGMQPRTDSPGLGLGLPLIASLTDRFAISPRVDGGTELCMSFELAPPFVAAPAPLVD